MTPAILNALFELNNKADGIKVLHQIETNDGFKISVQASEFHYCTPRDNDGPYDSVEAAFPSDDDISEIVEYAEDPSDLTDTVYAYTPIEAVCDLINRRGGFK